MSYWLSQPKIRTNFIVMTFVWLATTFNRYLVMFLLKNFGQVYTTTTFFSIGSMSGYVLGGFLFNRLGVVKCFRLGFSMSSGAGLLILLIGLNNMDSWLFPVLVMIAQFGTAFSLGLCYQSNSHLFPTLFAATAMG